MAEPTFIVIGAARAGTTSLYKYLKQHPQVFMSSIKEPNFFAFDEKVSFSSRFRGHEDDYPVKDFLSYLALFHRALPGQATGEASTRYLSHPIAAERIRRFLPHVKLVVVLRDPADRAYSSYLHHVRRNSEPRSFRQALEEERNGRREGLIYGRSHYLETGFYYKHLSRYLARFDRHRLTIHLYEDLEQQSAALMRKIYAHLEVDETFTPDMSIRYNISGIPRNRTVNALLDRLWAADLPGRLLSSPLFRPVKKHFFKMRSHNLERPAIPEDIRGQLIACYQEDVLRLQDLLDRDLSSWLK